MLSNLRRQLKSEEGSTSPLFMIFFLCLLAYAMINLERSLFSLNLMRARNSAYLCTKKLIKRNDSYIKLMLNFNHVIRVSTPLQFVPYPAVSKAATRVIKASKDIQNSYHTIHILRVMRIKECNKKQITLYYLKLPAKTKNGLMLKRTMIQTVQMRKKWKNTLYFNVEDRFSSDTFAINLEYQIHNMNIVKTLKTKVPYSLRTKEISKVALLK